MHIVYDAQRKCRPTILPTLPTTWIKYSAYYALRDNTANWPLQNIRRLVAFYIVYRIVYNIYHPYISYFDSVRTLLSTSRCSVNLLLSNKEYIHNWPTHNTYNISTYIFTLCRRQNRDHVHISHCTNFQQWMEKLLLTNSKTRKGSYCTAGKLARLSPSTRHCQVEVTDSDDSRLWLVGVDHMFALHRQMATAPKVGRHQPKMAQWGLAFKIKRTWKHYK